MDKRKVPKSARLLKLVEVFERGQVLDKKEIDAKMSNLLGEERSGLSLALYRDLQDLVNQGILAQKYFRADGAEIDTENLEGEKYYNSKWHLAAADHMVVGKGLLVQIGGNLLLSERLRNSVAVRENGPLNAREVHVIFDLGKAFRLSIAKDDLPVKILVCRSTPQLVPKLFSALEAKFGKRLVVLAFGDQTLSSAKDESKPGHLLLEISGQEIKALEFNPRNPSVVAGDCREFWSGYIAALPAGDLNQTFDQRHMDVGGLTFSSIPAAGSGHALPAVLKIADVKPLLIG